MLKCWTHPGLNIGITKENPFEILSITFSSAMRHTQSEVRFGFKWYFVTRRLIFETNIFRQTSVWEEILLSSGASQVWCIYLESKYDMYFNNMKIIISFVQKPPPDMVWNSKLRLKYSYQQTRVATKIPWRFWGRAADTASMIL